MYIIYFQMGVCCSKKECIILDKKMISDKNFVMNDSQEDSIIEVMSNNKKINLETKSSNDDSNKHEYDENNYNSDIDNDNNLKSIKGPILRLLLKKKIYKSGDSPIDEMNGSTNIIKI